MKTVKITSSDVHFPIFQGQNITVISEGQPMPDHKEITENSFLFMGSALELFIGLIDNKVSPNSIDLNHFPTIEELEAYRLFLKVGKTDPDNFWDIHYCDVFHKGGWCSDDVATVHFTGIGSSLLKARLESLK